MPSERQPSYQKHTNKERMVKCPYCGEVVFARGLYLHIYHYANDEHGGPQNVPADYDERKQNLEEAGSRKISLVIPTTKNFDHELTMCKWCGETFKGTHGLGTHLGRVNDDLHPADADFESSGIRIPANEEHEPVWTAEMEEELADHVEFDPGEIQEKLTFENPPEEIEITGSVPASKLEELARSFERKAAQDEEAVWGLAAERVRALIERET